MSANAHISTPDPIKLNLVVRARKGDSDAWNHLVTRHNALLRSIARHYRLTDDDVADVVQITWLRCLEHFDQLRQPESFTTWLCTTCRREAQRVARAKHRQVFLDGAQGEASPLAALADQECGPLEQAVRNDESTRLRHAITELPPRQQAVLNEFLREDDDGGYAARSRRLGMPKGSLGPTRARAMETLRRDARLIAAG